MYPGAGVRLGTDVRCSQGCNSCAIDAVAGSKAQEVAYLQEDLFAVLEVVG
jgi:hypothetical protein